MKKFLLCLSFSFLITQILFAQPVIQWQKTLGGTGIDIPYSIQQTTDNGYVIAGQSSSTDFDVTSNHGNYDYWVVKTDSSGAIQWQKSLGGTGVDVARQVQQTFDGGYIISGYSRSNNGDITGHHGSASISDFWIVKLDVSGNLQWQKSLGGTGWDEATSIVQTSDSGFIIGGYTTSNDGDITVNNGYYDYWVVKLNYSGAMLWQKTLGGTNDDEAYSIKQTTDDGFIIAGYSNSNDSDVTGNHGDYDYWVVKLDTIGNIQWQKTLGGSLVDKAYSIIQTLDGGYAVTGSSTSNDGDVTGNHYYEDYWVAKLDTAGTIQWQKSLGGSSLDAALSIIQSADGGYVLAGNSWSNDGNVSGHHGMMAQWDAWILKLDTVGILLWQQSYGGTDVDRAYSIVQTSAGDYVFCGDSESDDYDVNGHYGTSTTQDYSIFKITNEYNAITGKLFIDINSNSIQDAGENSIINNKVTEVNTNRFAFSNQNGKYNVAVFDTGNFSVVPAIVSYYSVVPVNHTANFTAIHQIDSINDFALQPSGVFNDLCVTITPLGPFRSSFAASYMINYANYGTTSLSADVIFFPDSSLSFISSNVTPTSVTTDSVVWNTGLLAPYQSGSIVVTVSINIGISILTPVTSNVRIEPVINDANPVNNLDTNTVITTGSYDPNDITVDEDTLTTTQLSTSPFLEYTIRFQNTGNDTAFTVAVLNPVDINKLELSTFEFLNSSHPANINWINHNSTMEFKFNNILLPDSNANEPLSHGFITYRIKPKTTLVAGDSITSSAGIYFDFNAPVYTNTAATHIVLPTSTSNLQYSTFNLQLFPNPLTTQSKIIFSNSKKENFLFTLYDITGRITKTISTSSNQLVLEKGNMQSGVYLFSLKNTSTSETVNGKIIIQ